MSGTEKVTPTLGTDAWMDAAERVLVRFVAESGTDRTFCVAEVYSQVPDEVCPGGGDIGWALDVRDGVATFVRHADVDADVRLTMRHDVATALAVLPTSAQAPGGAAHQILLDAVAEGAVSLEGDVTRLPPFTLRFHDALLEIYG